MTKRVFLKNSSIKKKNRKENVANLKSELTFKIKSKTFNFVFIYVSIFLIYSII